MEEVKLRIKSANRITTATGQTADLQLACSVRETVAGLKRRIEAEHVGHPPAAGQKLVYAGKLLMDGQAIGDVLRFEDECSVFTIHLVCRPVESSGEKDSTTTVNGANTAPICTNINTATTNVNSSSNNANDNGALATTVSGGTEQLPLSTATTADNSSTHAELEAIGQMIQTLVLQEAMTTSTPTTQDYQQHESECEQLYRQYIALYRQHVQNQVPAHPLAPLVIPQQQQQQQEQQPAAPAAQEADGGAAVEDAAANNNNNDLLDYAYAIIRVLILLCVMYVHSSFLRLLVVAVVLLAACFLHNRNQRRQMNNNNNNNVNDHNQQLPMDNEIPADPVELDRTADVATAGTDEPKPHPLVVAFTFVRTLLTSVIPQDV